LTDDGVYFSELSPRPHDTGMVTLAGTQNFNEFELHLRAILSLPIFEITLEKVERVLYFSFGKFNQPIPE
jgi:phosphoribosylglycinamide formyltransferase 2